MYQVNRYTVTVYKLFPFLPFCHLIEPSGSQGRKIFEIIQLSIYRYHENLHYCYPLVRLREYMEESISIQETLILKTQGKTFQKT